VVAKVEMAGGVEDTRTKDKSGAEQKQRPAKGEMKHLSRLKIFLNDDRKMQVWIDPRLLSCDLMQMC